MSTKYKTVNTKTLKGLKQAEALQRNGWKIISVGLWDIQFEKRTEKKRTIDLRKARKVKQQYQNGE